MRPVFSGSLSVGCAIGLTYELSSETMSASQRTKGAQGEREWCQFLIERGWLGAKRVLGQARDSGGDVAVPPVLYEVKRRHAISVRQFLNQAAAALPKYKGCKMPVVAMREDGNPNWMVLMDAKDFLTILQLTRRMGDDAERSKLERLL